MCSWGLKGACRSGYVHAGAGELALEVSRIQGRGYVHAGRGRGVCVQGVILEVVNTCMHHAAAAQV